MRWKRLPIYFIGALAFSVLAGCASTRPPASPAITPPAVAGILPVSAADNHCLDACPGSAPASNVVVRRILYTLSNNGRTKFADWVAYVVREQWIGTGENRDWAPDPALDPNDTLEVDDYDDANSVDNYEMGHQAPLQSFGAAQQWAETNYLSNITPQVGNLNGGRWRSLENAERRLAQRLHRPVYVLTGPLYEEPMHALPHAEPHRVPSGYWKVVALPDGRVVGFIFHNRAETHTPYCSERVHISDIESHSGLDLFPGIALSDLQVMSTELGCQPLPDGGV